MNCKTSEEEAHIPEGVVVTTDGDLVVECNEEVWLRIDIDVVVLFVFVVTDVISELFGYGSIENQTTAVDCLAFGNKNKILSLG